jgi:hypothetical protein
MPDSFVAIEQIGVPKITWTISKTATSLSMFELNKSEISKV